MDRRVAIESRHWASALRGHFRIVFQVVRLHSREANFDAGMRGAVLVTDVDTGGDHVLQAGDDGFSADEPRGDQVGPKFSPLIGFLDAIAPRRGSPGSRAR